MLKSCESSAEPTSTAPAPGGGCLGRCGSCRACNKASTRADNACCAASAAERAPLLLLLGLLEAKVAAVLPLPVGRSRTTTACGGTRQCDADRTNGDCDLAAETQTVRGALPQAATAQVTWAAGRANTAAARSTAIRAKWSGGGEPPAAAKTGRHTSAATAAAATAASAPCAANSRAAKTAASSAVQSSEDLPIACNEAVASLMAHRVKFDGHTSKAHLRACSWRQRFASSSTAVPCPAAAATTAGRGCAAAAGAAATAAGRGVATAAGRTLATAFD